MTDAEMARLAEIESRLKTTTPSPWEWLDDTRIVNPDLWRDWWENSRKDNSPAACVKRGEAMVLEATWCNDGTTDLEMRDEDRQFIVNAPTDIAWLIEQLRKQ